MDYKVFRTAVLAIVSALILVLVIVYATNADKINEIFGKGGASGEGASAATSSSSDIGMYGEQIGDNTQSFLYEEGFFDANEEIPSFVVTKKNEESASSATSEIVADDNEEYNDYIEPASVVGKN